MQKPSSARPLLALIAVLIIIVGGSIFVSGPGSPASAAPPPKPTVTVTVTTTATQTITTTVTTGPTVTTTVTQTVTTTAPPVTVTETVTTTPPPPPTGNCTKPESGPIQNLAVGGPIVIENKCFHDFPGAAIVLSGATSVTIRNNEFLRVGDGITINGSSGSGPITIEDNYFQDINPPGSTPWNTGAQAIQFESVRDRAGIVVQNNTVDGGRFEDIISFWQSGGTAASPALVTRNRLRACRPGGLCFESDTGSGITAGDNGGSPGSYVRIRENLLVSPGQVGLAIAGGSNDSLERNIVYGGSSLGLGGTGAYIWDWQNVGNCVGHQIIGNRSNWTTGVQFTDRGNCTYTQSNNIWGDTRLNDSLWGQSWNQLLLLLN